MKINISIIERYIQMEADNIHKLDEKQLPDVLTELRLVEKHGDPALREVDPRDITEISQYAIEEVFTCWSFDERFDEWIAKMEKEQYMANSL